MAEETKTNRLAHEKSPYLLQHARNPVGWYPWGEEALAAAKKNNKPIFLSIGYSTCHWCHVMAHESFEDPTIAKLINDTFVPVKVDREERPDIDMFYMKVCQLLTGSGGWPLTIMMTPDKQPFFTGTYIQKETRFGRTGLLELIPRIKDLWEKHDTEVLSSANQIMELVYNQSLIEPGGELGAGEINLAYTQLKQNFDKEHGGFGLAPKFPLPHSIMFLLRCWKRTGDVYALDMARKTLDAMRRGGIYDHIGFGFHRYSTDPIWLAPHFEKMLYDQALLATVYTEVYQATGKKEYADTAHEICDYVLRDMTAPDGGFYSAEDADSEGKEGKFYLWTCDEIDSVLTPEESSLFRNVFNIESGGNFPPETGNADRENIVHRQETLKTIAYELSIPEEALREQIERMRKKLYEARNKRIHPHKDDKILTDWNGLMIAALAKASGVLGENRYRTAAENAAAFIFNNMVSKTGELLHRYRDGQAALPGNLDDYAFLIDGLLELYDDTFEIDYLKKALNLNDYLIRHFWDKKSGAFFFTTDNSEDLIIRQKEIYDGAIPSGNSFAMLNLLRLASITGNSEFEEKAAGISRAFYTIVKESPSNHTLLMCAADYAIGPSYEIIIKGRKQFEDTASISKSLKRVFLPNKVTVLVPPEPDAEIKQLAPFTANYPADTEKAKIYICINHECKLPTTDVKKALELLNPVKNV